MALIIIQPSRVLSKNLAGNISDSGMKNDVAGRRREVPIQTLKINHNPSNWIFLSWCTVYRLDYFNTTYMEKNVS